MDDIEKLRTDLITNRPKLGGYSAFAAAANLSPSWVYKFAENRIAEPRKRNLSKLRVALAAALQPKA